MVKKMALGVCVYKSYERSKSLVATCSLVIDMYRMGLPKKLLRKKKRSPF